MLSLYLIEISVKASSNGDLFQYDVAEERVEGERREERVEGREERRQRGEERARDSERERE